MSKYEASKVIKNIKKYFVNMISNSKKIHRTGCGNCQYSINAYKYIEFDNIDDAIDFFKN